MRTHGWAGDPPADDDEAVRRIQDATRRCVERTGARATIADVARELGVTRQTVYRYFPSSDALMRSAALPAVTPFLDALSAHLVPIGDRPDELAVEAVAHAIHSIPDDPFLGLLLHPDRASQFGDTFTSTPARALARSVLDRFPVDWEARGLDDRTLDELGEYLLRTIQSFVIAPSEPARDGDELRAFLMRWIGPGVRDRTGPTAPTRGPAAR